MKSIVGHVIIGVEDTQLCGGQHVFVPRLNILHNDFICFGYQSPFCTWDHVKRHTEFQH